jgi:hypothetical protein
VGRIGDRRRGRGHLPPGHQPGAQSRRAGRGLRIGVGILILAGLGFLGGAGALLATANNLRSPSGARVGAAVFVGCALLLLLLGLYLWRRGHPRQADYLELRVEPLELARGQTVTATLVIRDPHRLGESLELGLVCTEFYDARTVVYTQYGSQTRRVIRTVDAFASWSQPDRGQARQTLSFEIPADGLFSYEGSVVSWAWRVSLRDRHPHRPDAHRDVPVWVSP